MKPKAPEENEEEDGLAVVNPVQPFGIPQVFLSIMLINKIKQIKLLNHSYTIDPNHDVFIFFIKRIISKSGLLWFDNFDIKVYYYNMLCRKFPRNKFTEDTKYRFLSYF
jgi:hypothetical protein